MSKAMTLPPNVSLKQVSPTMVEVSGWASEPFVMTEGSAKKSLERVRSRRSTYSPEDYTRHLSLYVDVFALMGWDIPVDPNAPIPEAEPVPATKEAVAAPNVQSEAENTPISIPEEPVAAPQAESDPALAGYPDPLPEPREPPIPGPVRMDGPIRGPEKTWIEKMVEDA